MSFNINAGELSKKITFFKQGEDENSLGETVPVFQEHKTVWAKLTPVRGREYNNAERTKYEYTHTALVRYFSGIAEDMQIRYKSRTYDIVSIINPGEANKLLEIKCKEVII